MSSGTSLPYDVPVITVIGVDGIEMKPTDVIFDAIVEEDEEDKDEVENVTEQNYSSKVTLNRDQRPTMAEHYPPEFQVTFILVYCVTDT